MKRFLIAFAGFQVIGCALPLLANIHSNATPLFVGIALLFPGSILVGLLPFPATTSAWVGYAAMLPINLAAWVLVYKYRGKLVGIQADADSDMERRKLR